MRKTIVFFSLAATLATGCTGPSSETKTLPILGEREPRVTIVDGKPKVDTLYHSVPDFAFLNQDSQMVTQQTVANKIYVADFFFTSCPSICPKMKSQMLRVYEKFKNNPRVALLSHSIDPTHDTVAVLRDYADRLGVKSSTWHFLTGNRDTILDLAQKHYYTSAMVDKSVPGGFEHSGAFLLVDEQRRLRGHYDGTNAQDVDKLLKDMEVLLAEKKR